MYHPASPDAPEFIEIKNIGDKKVNLFDPKFRDNTWALTGVRYKFPKDITLKPGQYAVVSSVAPAVFRERYGLPESVRVFGPFEGALSNGGERVSLLRPDEPDTEAGETIVPMLEVDSVRYKDGPKWPQDADGDGASIQRVKDSVFGDEPKSWKSSGRAGGTPGDLPLDKYPASRESASSLESLPAVPTPGEVELVLSEPAAPVPMRRVHESGEMYVSTRPQVVNEDYEEQVEIIPRRGRSVIPIFAGVAVACLVLFVVMLSLIVLIFKKWK